MTDSADNSSSERKKSRGDDSSKAKRAAGGAMPLFQDMPPRHIKGTRRFIIAGLILAIAIPTGLGLLFYVLRSLVVNPQ